MAMKSGNYSRLTDLLKLCKNDCNKLLKILIYVYKNNKYEFEICKSNNDIKKLLVKTIEQEEGRVYPHSQGFCGKDAQIHQLHHEDDQFYRAY